MKNPNWDKKLATFCLVCLMILVITETFTPVFEKAETHKPATQVVQIQSLPTPQLTLVNPYNRTFLSAAAGYPDNPFHLSIPPHSPENPVQGEFFAGQRVTTSGTASITNGTSVVQI